MAVSVDIAIRGLPLEVKKKIRAEAGARDMSMNKMIIEILTKWAEKK